MAARLDRWLADPSRRAEALRLYESLVGHGSARHAELTPSDIRRFVKPRLERALRSGELVAIANFTLPPKREKTHAWSAVAVEKAAAAGAAPSDKPREKSWAAIRIVGMNGKGLSGIRYSVRLPDGPLRDGNTGPDGAAHFDGIEAGTIEVSFPELDRDAWEPA